MNATAIPWTDITWNHLRGCRLAGPGCLNCYAMRQAARSAYKPGGAYEGLVRRTDRGPVWTGQIRYVPSKLFEPLNLRPRDDRPWRVFVASMSDPFHEDLPLDVIDETFAIMALVEPSVAMFQILTKRSKRAEAYTTDRLVRLRVVEHVMRIARSGGTGSLCAREPTRVEEAVGRVLRWPLPNVIGGVSVSTQQTANRHVPEILGADFARRALSLEPLLERVELGTIESHAGDAIGDTLITMDNGHGQLASIDWIIVGGESGPRARPMDRGWAVSLLGEAVNAKRPFFFKQWGDASPSRDPDAKHGGDELNGRQWHQFPSMSADPDVLD